MNGVIKRLVKELVQKDKYNEKFVSQVCDLLLKSDLITQEEVSDIKIKYYTNKVGD